MNKLSLSKCQELEAEPTSGTLFISNIPRQCPTQYSYSKLTIAINLIRESKCGVYCFQFSPKYKAACSSHDVGSIIPSTRKDKDIRQSSLKQKLSSVLCPDKMTLCRKRPNNAATLYRFLSDCFNKMPPAKPCGECSFVLPVPLILFCKVKVSVLTDKIKHTEF